MSIPVFTNTAISPVRTHVRDYPPQPTLSSRPSLAGRVIQSLGLEKSQAKGRIHPVHLKGKDMETISHTPGPAATLQVLAPPPAIIPSRKQFSDTLPEGLTERYAITAELAAGGFGKVYMGIRRDTGGSVTIKFVVGNKDVEKDRIYDEAHGWLPREAYFMTRLSGFPSTVQLLDMRSIPSSGYVMIMETAGTEWRWVDAAKRQSRMSRDLMGLIRQCGRLQYKHVHHIFRSIVDTVYRMHTRGIHHGDMKCLNVLVDARFRVKICDFGAAVEQGQPGPSYFAGTRIFSPPEVLLKGAQDPELIESWTLGVILYTMYHGVGPYRKLEEIVDPIHRPAWRVDDIEAKALCRALMHKSPEKRMRLRDAWMHPWVKLADLPKAGESNQALIEVRHHE